VKLSILCFATGFQKSDVKLICQCKKCFYFECRKSFILVIRRAGICD